MRLRQTWLAVIVAGFGGLTLSAQIANNPYKVIYDWDKLEGIYVADGMSDATWNPGWERGIRIGDLETGWLKAFIPDEEPTRGAGTEFIGVDSSGRIFSGASGRPGLVVHQLARPLF